MLVIHKSDSRFVDFVNHSSDYRPNRTPLGPITIIDTAVRIFYVAVRLSVVDYRLRKHEVTTKKGLWSPVECVTDVVTAYIHGRLPWSFIVQTHSDIVYIFFMS